jgi:hypothetical protein
VRRAGYAVGLPAPQPDDNAMAHTDRAIPLIHGISPARSGRT